jgi:hypothetical protein
MSLLLMTRLINLWPAIAIISVVAFAYFKGHSNGEDKTQLAYLQKNEKAIAYAIMKAKETNKQHQKIANIFHSGQAKAETDIQTIQKKVMDYVDKHHHNNNCDLDIDGMQLINDFINAANSGSSTD